MSTYNNIAFNLTAFSSRWGQTKSPCTSENMMSFYNSIDVRCLLGTQEALDALVNKQKWVTFLVFPRPILI